MTLKLRKGMLFGLGSPLLDMSATVEKDTLHKYSLKADDSILADERHTTLYTDLAENFDCSYIAGGSTLNTMRVFQWVVQVPEVATFAGSIGHDKFGDILEQKSREAGVNVMFHCTEEKPTGTCAVLLSEGGRTRSLCANLAAAQLYTAEHLKSPETMVWVERATLFYSEGFFLNNSTDSLLFLAKHAHQQEKLFSLNLSAPFICRLFKDNMMTIFPYVDILFGNDTEAREFADVHNLGTNGVMEIAKRISQFPKKRTSFERMVVITQGADEVIVVHGCSTRCFHVPKLHPDEIVDTNGAGDAFVGGFLAMYMMGKSIEECVRCGIAVSAEIVKKSGCTLPDRNDTQTIEYL